MTTKSYHEDLADTMRDESIPEHRRYAVATLVSGSVDPALAAEAHAVLRALAPRVLTNRHVPSDDREMRFPEYRGI